MGSVIAFIGRFIVLFSLLSSLASSASTLIAPVIVTGEGSSFWDAREDCVRQALQQSLPQLVIADRRIEDDKVVRDSVLSTMNGFVESFRVLEQSEAKGSIRLKAEVQISESDIENFVLASGKGGARINSDSILGEISRDDLARTSRSEILRRLFEGFPTQAFDVRVKKVELDPEQRGQVIATVEVQLNKQFVKNLKSGLRVLGMSGDSDSRRPEQLTVCFASSTGAYREMMDCTATEIDSSALQLRKYNGGQDDSIRFLLWFSGDGNPGSAVVFEPTYLEKSNSGDRFFEKTSTGSEVWMSGPREIVISEGAHLYRIKVPRQGVPEGATQIHAMPLFVSMESLMPVVIDMFGPWPSLRSPEFEVFSRSITQGDH
jgi:hypothetical protein